VLGALAREVLIPNARRLIAETRALDGVMRGLGAEEQTFEIARAAFEKALPVWKRAYAFRSGPLEKSNVFLRAMFWPARPAAIDAVLEEGRPVDERLVQELGADQKGLFGLEYVLFDPKAAARGVAPDARGERIRRYAREVSSNVLGYAERLGRQLGDGRAFASALSESGQDGVHQLVAQAVDSIEIVWGKLDRVVRASARMESGAAVVEGYFSGLSLALASELLAGTSELYRGARGGGLSDLVRGVQTPLDVRTRALFADAEAKLRGLGAPLERAFQTDRKGFERAQSALKTLERALKLEVASSLGITLAFGSADGD
jgi:predicted lipoprotein